MNLRALLFAFLTAFAAPQAHAGGFGVKDLGVVAVDANAALGAVYTHQAEAARLTLTCVACEDRPVVDVQLGRQDDGTEQRVRSGETTIAKLQSICQSRSPTCNMSALEVAPAVGWISTYTAGGRAGSTAVILRGGDSLTIRSVAADETSARRNAQKVLEAISRTIVGR